MTNSERLITRSAPVWTPQTARCLFAGRSVLAYVLNALLNNSTINSL